MRYMKNMDRELKIAEFIESLSESRQLSMLKAMTMRLIECEEVSYRECDAQGGLPEELYWSFSGDPVGEDS